MKLDAALPAMKALGVPEIAAYLAGDIDREEAIARASTASRNYAKRQLTWFKHQLVTPEVLSAQFSESLTQIIFPFIRRFLLTEAP